jgi:hypothetical protein
MQSVISSFVELSGKPFINKNPRNSVRVAGLLETFPEAVIVVVRRNNVYVAQSLYIARVGRQPTENGSHRWWGTKPREFITLRHLDPLQQAVGQTRAIEQELRNQLLTHSGSCVEIDYDDICANPAAVLSEIQNECKKRGLQLQTTSVFRSAPFPNANSRKVSEVEFNSIQSLLNQA